MLIKEEQFKYIVDRRDFHCALDVTMHYIGGKWKAVVLWYLRKEKKRFGELKNLIPDITDKMLSIQLKSLEEDGIISRTVYPEIPPRVEYEYTEKGKSLIPVIEAIAHWGNEKARKEGELVKVVN